MAKNFVLETHQVYKAVRKAGIGFPCTKAECVAKAGDLMIKTDPEHSVPMREILERMPLERYENGAAFYSAYYYMIQRG